jgi:hypothetical protein
MMTISEILGELTPYTGTFPESALQAAIEQREAIIPELLRCLEAVAADPVAFTDPEYMLHLYALHLLAQFREARAYRLITKIFSAPGDIPYKLAGDTVTEGLKRILASVYDGDPAPLQSLIENPTVDEFVRDAGINAYVVLHDTGLVPRETVIGYFKSLFEGGLEKTPSLAWCGLVCAVADIAAPELIEQVRWAYAEGLADPGFSDLGSLEEDIFGRSGRSREPYTLITNTINEMEWWAAFHQEDDDIDDIDHFEDDPADFEEEEDFAATTPIATLAPPIPIRRVKIGRNEPCPCGSGKKYKKCCGSASSA